MSCSDYYNGLANEREAKRIKQEMDKLSKGHLAYNKQSKRKEKWNKLATF